MVTIESTEDEAVPANEHGLQAVHQFRKSLYIVFLSSNAFDESGGRGILHVLMATQSPTYGAHQSSQDTRHIAGAEDIWKAATTPSQLAIICDQCNAPASA